MAKYASGEYLQFKEIPKADEKDILSHAKTDGIHIGTKVDSENLPPVIRQLSTKLLIYKTEIWMQAQSYFTRCQTKITEAEALHNIKKISNHLANKTLMSDNLDLPKVKASLSTDYHAFEIQRDNYEKFKKQNGLTFLPKNADPKETRFQKLILMGLFILEFTMNFNMIDSGGAVTVSESLAISSGQTAVNIISCYLLGKVGIGYLLHAKTLATKLILTFAVSLHILVIGVINANMGLYRNTIVANANAGGEYGGAGELLASSFQLWPWDKMAILNVTDYIVVFMGLVFAILAFLDGLKSDDTYPGYGHVYRGALRIKSKILGQVKDINEGWNQCLKRFNRTQTEASDNACKSITLWSMETNAIEQVWSDYKKHINTLEEVFDGALKLYTSNYNRFHTEDKIQLKAQLLNNDEFDLHKQFEDVAKLYLDDGTRKKKEDEKNERFSKEFSELKKELAGLNQEISKEIQEISERYSCKLS